MMFTDNKYCRWYLELCERARGRVLSECGERHHVIPKSLGGSNAAGNMVALTYREHFLAHWLLTKCTAGDDRRKMLRALWAMTWRSRTHQRVVTSRQYAIARAVLPELGRAIGLAGKGRAKTAEHKRRIADANRGKAKTPEHRAKLAAHSPSAEHRQQISAKLTGRTYSPETLVRMRAANVGRPHTAENKAKVSAALKGRVIDDQWRAKISAGVKGKRLGVPQSPEHRAKIGAAARKRVRDERGCWIGANSAQQ